MPQPEHDLVIDVRARIIRTLAKSVGYIEPAEIDQLVAAASLTGTVHTVDEAANNPTAWREVIRRIERVRRGPLDVAYTADGRIRLVDRRELPASDKGAGRDR